MSKTNAVRYLETLGIRYELREYAVDPDDLSAETVAAKVGLPPEQVFKTLLMRGDRNGLAFAVVPGNAEVDAKALARLTGDRRIEMVTLKEVQPLTGQVRGGVTAIGQTRGYPVFVDETVEIFDIISVSAGVRGTQVLLDPQGYLRAVAGTVGPIARDKQP
ncbi:MAG: Cys-tRNA(Pro) deacylase [Acidobacteria bacterium]|nr:Cys-tRNA(Pro) deacylase [Acidobacteriota bacterium]